MSILDLSLLHTEIDGVMILCLLEGDMSEFRLISPPYQNYCIGNVLQV